MNKKTREIEDQDEELTSTSVVPYSPKEEVHGSGAQTSDSGNVLIVIKCMLLCTLTAVQVVINSY